MVFLIAVTLWYLSIFILIYINYRMLTNEYIEIINKTTEAQIKANKAAVEWQKEQFYLNT